MIIIDFWLQCFQIFTFRFTPHFEYRVSRLICAHSSYRRHWKPLQFSIRLKSHWILSANGNLQFASCHFSSIFRAHSAQWRLKGSDFLLFHPNSNQNAQCRLQNGWESFWENDRFPHSSDPLSDSIGTAWVKWNSIRLTRRGSTLQLIIKYRSESVITVSTIRNGYKRVWKYFRNSKKHTKNEDEMESVRNGDPPAFGRSRSLSMVQYRQNRHFPGNPTWNCLQYLASANRFITKRPVSIFVFFFLQKCYNTSNHWIIPNRLKITLAKQRRPHKSSEIANEMLSKPEHTLLITLITWLQSAHGRAIEANRRHEAFVSLCIRLIIDYSRPCILINEVFGFSTNAAQFSVFAFLIETCGCHVRAEILSRLLRLSIFALIYITKINAKKWGINGWKTTQSERDFSFRF